MEPVSVVAVAVIAMAAGVVVATGWWRMRITRALVELARMSKAGPIGCEDVVLAFGSVLPVASAPKPRPPSVQQGKGPES